MIDYLKLADEAAAAMNGVHGTYDGLLMPWHLVERLEQAVRELVRDREAVSGALDSVKRGWEISSKNYVACAQERDEALAEIERLRKVAAAAVGLQSRSREFANDWEYEANNDGYYVWDTRLTEALEALKPSHPPEGNQPGPLPSEGFKD